MSNYLTYLKITTWCFKNDKYGDHVTAIPFSIFGFISAVIILFLLPETNGCNLIETIEELEGNTTTHEIQPLQPSKLLNLSKKDQNDQQK